MSNPVIMYGAPSGPPYGAPSGPPNLEPYDPKEFARRLFKRQPTEESRRLILSEQCSEEPKPWQCPSCKMWYAPHIASCNCEVR